MQIQTKDGVTSASDKCLTMESALWTPQQMWILCLAFALTLCGYLL